MINNKITHFSKPNNFKAMKSILMSFFLQASALFMILFSDAYAFLYYLGWSVHSLNIVRIFIQMHDMAHYSFFSNSKLNYYIGTLFGIYTYYPFIAWRDGHNHHHKHFGNLDRFDASQTILFTKKEYEKMPLVKKTLIRIFRDPFVFFTITIPFAWNIGTLFLFIKRYGLISKVTTQKLMSYVLYIFLNQVFNVPLFELCFSIYFASLVGGILFHLQHSVNVPYRKHQNEWDKMEASLEGSTYLQIPFPLNIFTNGIEYHHIHHLNTMVPCYNLSDCHNSIDLNEWKKLNINIVDYNLAFKSLFNVMLDEDKKLLVNF